MPQGNLKAVQVCKPPIMCLHFPIDEVTVNPNQAIDQQEAQEVVDYSEEQKKGTRHDFGITMELEVFFSVPK